MRLFYALVDRKYLRDSWCGISLVCFFASLVVEMQFS